MLDCKDANITGPDLGANMALRMWQPSERTENQQGVFAALFQRRPSYHTLPETRLSLSVTTSLGVPWLLCAENFDRFFYSSVSHLSRSHKKAAFASPLFLCVSFLIPKVRIIFFAFFHTHTHTSQPGRHLLP